MDAREPVVPEGAPSPAAIERAPAAPDPAWVQGRAREVRDVLGDLRSLAGELAPGAPYARETEMLLSLLDDLFLIVVVGEVKSGKSALINALLGRRVLKEGPTPVTDRLYAIRDREAAGPAPRGEGVAEVVVAAPILRNTCIVDTPGTNSLIREHQERTEGFLPRCDLVLFLSSVDRPLAESERRLLDLVHREWGKRFLLVLSKTDTREEGEVLEVRAYLEDSVERLLGVRPRVFPVSARRALRAKEEGDGEGLRRSGLAELEGAVSRLLGDGERVRLKLQSPLLSAGRLAARLDCSLAGRAGAIGADRARIAGFRRRVEETGAALLGRLETLPPAWEGALRAFRARGEGFLQRRFHPFRFGLFRDAGKVDGDFRREVWLGLEEELERGAAEVSEDLLREAVRLWEMGVRFMGEMQRDPEGAGAPAFESRRAEVARGLREDYRALLMDFDPGGEARRLADAAYGASVGFLGAQAGAAAVAVLAVAAHSLPLGVAGVVLAGSLAAVGVALPPLRRGRILERFRRRVERLRESLLLAFRREGRASVEELIRRTLETAAPLEEFLGREEARLGRERDRTRELMSRIGDLEARIASGPGSAA